MVIQLLGILIVLNPRDGIGGSLLTHILWIRLPILLYTGVFIKLWSLQGSPIRSWGWANQKIYPFKWHYPVFFLTQDNCGYSQETHLAWIYIRTRQMSHIETYMSTIYLQNIFLLRDYHMESLVFPQWWMQYLCYLIPDTLSKTWEPSYYRAW